MTDWLNRCHFGDVRDVLRLEIAGSLRLFGGLPALLRRVREDLTEMDLDAYLAVAATPLAARRRRRLTPPRCASRWPPLPPRCSWHKAMTAISITPPARPR